MTSQIATESLARLSMHETPALVTHDRFRTVHALLWAWQCGASTETVDESVATTALGYPATAADLLA